MCKPISGQDRPFVLPVCPNVLLPLPGKSKAFNRKIKRLFWFTGVGKKTRFRYTGSIFEAHNESSISVVNQLAIPVFVQIFQIGLIKKGFGYYLIVLYAKNCNFS